MTRCICDNLLDFKILKWLLTHLNTILLHTHFYSFPVQQILSSSSTQPTPTTLLLVMNTTTPNPPIIHPRLPNPLPTISTSPIRTTPITNLSVPPPPKASHLANPNQVTRSTTRNLKPCNIFDLAYVLSNNQDPTSFTQDVKHEHCHLAMSTEFQALQQLGMCSLVPPPLTQTILGCKWMYRAKFHADCNITQHKTQLVDQGHQQKYWIDYIETFSPVTKLTTIWVFSRIVVTHKWSINQLDICNTFPHAHPSETIYINKPQDLLILSILLMSVDYIKCSIAPRNRHNNS